LLVAPLDEAIAMAKEKKDSPPDHIEKFYKLDRKIDILRDTTELEHINAYHKAADKHLKDDKGNLIMERLRDKDTRKKFTDTMVKHYLTKAKEVLGVKGDHKFGSEEEEHFYNEMLFNQYVGTSSDQFRRIIDAHKDNYKITEHTQNARHLSQRVTEQLRPLATEHIKPEEGHIDDIVRYIGADDLINPKAMEKEDAIKLLRKYDKGRGAITYADVEGEHYAVKKQKK